MKMNTPFIEEVNGAVVGRYLLCGSVYYEGRKQGPTLYAESISDLMRLSDRYIAEQRKELGGTFNDIFPRGSWELRVHD